MNGISMSSSDRVLRRLGRSISGACLIALAACASAQDQDLAQASAARAASDGKCFVLKQPTAGARIVDRSVMCQALERNLNEFCKGSSPSCGLKIAPGHTELSLPNWADVDLTENTTLLENMIRGEAAASQGTRWDAAEEEWSKVLERFRDMNREPPRLEVANVDILNRGQPEPVYQFWRSTCPMPSGLSAQPQILLGRHGEIPRNPDWRASINRGESPFAGAAIANNFGDVFFYEGVAFIFRWGGATIRAGNHLVWTVRRDTNSVRV